ncbi:hypothetical protein SUGI_0388550 [Cryptomeria japonica]|uniref:cysteine-rich receptor-like protein kinase 43 n=1 Tax=Cryptomeria japonica TaxID=3369 RepID=UPI002408B9CA|nr:cysteine-rich receptor-like protein kinase 43 [Cryptomeria japonica]GLJ21211.1 hypothetical protein SUGI_0388550 [Cryptomeria japonica]
MFLVLLFLMIFPSALCEHSFSVCKSSSIYTEGSTYSINLDTVINDLSRNAPQSSGFNRSSSGLYSNRVYGLLQCFGDASAAKCSDCSRQAYNVSLRDCTNAKGVRVLMDDCFLRYDNFNFTSTLDTYTYVHPNATNVTNNVLRFKSTTSSLLYNLSQEAYIPANKLFAAGSATYYFTSYATYYFPSYKVYGLVQCWRDSSIEDCRSCVYRARKELQQCCSSSQGAEAISGSCAVRYEIYQFFDLGKPSSSPSPSPSPSHSSPHRTTSTVTPTSLPVAHAPAKATYRAKSREKSSKTLPLLLGLVGGMIVVLLICLIAMRKRLKSAIFGEPVILLTHNEEGHGFSSEIGLLQPEQHFFFSLEELREATENFHEKKKLGEGGFGVVYKGSTRDGKEIAVKKLSAKSTQVNREFMNEVKLVASVQHRNLVKLLGCCAEGAEKLIVYEYLPNKSLDNFLFDPKKCRLLDWQKHYNIIIGIARGLLYLHEDSRMKIIHRDIKPNNILLDDKLDPKIADFGLARLFPEDETHIQTRAAGTCGYMAPEYAIQKHLSVKADVYSFGVLLLEIVSGKKNTYIQNLSEWAWTLYKGGNILDMMDSRDLEAYPAEQALRCIHVGLLCVQDDAALRPAMSNVILMISSSSVPLPIPTKPGFLTSSKSFASKSRSKSSSGSGGYEKSMASQTSETTTSSTSAVH